MAAPPPPDEELRLLVLEETEILDTPADPVFDAVVRLAADICEVPIALVSLIDAERQWFKARVGLDVQQTPREHAFCAHCILAGETFEIADTAADPRFSDNPLVTGPPHIRFYAGFPVRAGDGRALGTLCVIDRVPRSLTPAQRQSMRRLAHLISGLLQERRAAAMARKTAEANAEHLRRLALTDSVTGAYNRRGFMEQAAWAGDAGGALLLVEFDALTAIRDELGLAAAEAVVKNITSLAQRIVPENAVVGRLTAPTLAVFLPESTPEEARRLADRLRILLALTAVDAAGTSFSATITAGAAPVEKDRGVEGALAAAGTALAEARALGGDQVVICARSAPPPARSQRP